MALRELCQSMAPICHADDPHQINPRHSIQKDAHMAMLSGTGVVLPSLQQCGGSDLARTMGQYRYKHAFIIYKRFFFVCVWLL